MLEIGTIIGGYRIDRVLGSGGMGVVFEATHLLFGRTAALKVIAADLSTDEGLRERFRREGAIQARLDHPHIIPVWDGGETEHGLYIAMKVVRGPTLRDLILRNELDDGRVVRLLSQVADALDSAHEAGLIHRDIKPSNILVELHRDHAYLADFGVTKSRDGAGLTRAGDIVGTAYYMSPEQAVGGQAVEQSDIYALGAVLFECLTGQVPYPRETDVAVLFAHIYDSIPSVAEHRPDLQPSVDAVLSQALAKNPDERHATASELMRAVAAALTASGTLGTLESVRGETSPQPPSAPETVVRPRPDEPVRVAETHVVSKPANLPATVESGSAPDTRAETESPTAIPDAEVAARFDPGLDQAGETAPRPVVAAPPLRKEEVEDEVATDEATAKPATALEPEATPAPPTSPMGAAGPGEQAPPIPKPSPPDNADRQVTPALPTKPAQPSVDQDAAITERAARAPAKDQGRQLPGAPDPARGRRKVIEAVVAVTLVAGVVVGGFLLGRGGSNAGAPAAARASVVNAGGLRLNLPSGWQRGSPPHVPGLALRAEVTAAPEGRSGVGMFAGRLATVWPTFLPKAFAQSLASPPRGERVKLGHADAIRYAGLAPRGYRGIVDVYIFPQPDSSAAVVCFGGPASGPAARAPCAQIAAGAKLAGARPYPLEVPKEYVLTLRSAISRLNASRSRSADAISHAKALAVQAAAADGVARAYSRALTEIGRAPVTPYAEPASAKVATALGNARAAYVELTKAAQPPGHPAAWRRARTGVVIREAELSRALSGLLLLVLR